MGIIMIFPIKKLLKKLEKIMATQQEVVTSLQQISTQLTKVGEESSKTLQKVADLQAVIDQQGGAVSPELQEAVDALKAQVQLVDDLVPDAADVPTGDGTPTTDAGTQG